ncbi:hypothetical protein [Paenibacillus antarcticus]|uniref:Uncharacterized protein n=1 Tax=Paenibacillus antarcticus TaxID=253703 RepID=A0A168PWN9_9BACL|nr:hypothetical protein [Paenibacillus antarcticus]OAB47142.1 hypothetical protein PBAT_07625 [Paenibacillus antarcticus]
MIKRIHIFGASGSGASTLGRELSELLPHTLHDGDDLKSLFEVVIFLYVPQDSRVNRLQERALFRYGDDRLIYY